MWWNSVTFYQHVMRCQLQLRRSSLLDCSFLPNHGREGGSSHQVHLREGRKTSMRRVKMWRLARHANSILLHSSISSPVSMNRFLSELCMMFMVGGTDSVRRITN